MTSKLIGKVKSKMLFFGVVAVAGRQEVLLCCGYVERGVCSSRAGAREAALPRPIGGGAT